MDIQRWSPNGVPHGMAPSERGTFVSYADHVAALAQARADQSDLLDRHGQALYVKGQRDALALLAEACEVIDGLADQQAIGDDWYEVPLAKFRAAIKGESNG